MENFDGVGGGGSNVRTSEVVGEGGSERINCRRVGGSDGVSLETVIVEILFELIRQIEYADFLRYCLRVSFLLDW